MAPAVDRARPSRVEGTLLTLLEMAYGSKAPAAAVLERALALAGRRELPARGDEAVAFVRAHLLDILTVEVGPRLTMALIDDLVVSLESAPEEDVPVSGPPESMPRPVARVELRSRAAPPTRAELSVLIVDPDRVGRASLARAFVRVRWTVTVVDSVADLDEALSGSARIDAAIIDVQHLLAEPLASAIAAALPGVVLVVRSSDAGRARSLVGATGVYRSVLCSRETPPEELIEAVRRELGG
jgi:hypothetical protein